MRKQSRRTASVKTHTQYNSSRYIVHGSNPLNTDVEYGTAEVEPRPRRKLRRGSIRILYKKVQEEFNAKAVAYSILLVALFLVYMYIILCLNSATRHAERQLVEYKSTLQTIEEKNTYYETEISKSIDLELVEKTAKMRLGMSEPEAHQKKYINVPKQSYTTQNKE